MSQEKSQKTDWTIICTIIAMTLTIIGVMITMCLWLRSEASSDRREMTANLKDMSIELSHMEKRLEDKIDNLKDDFHIENKEVTSRLCKVEQQIYCESMNSHKFANVEK